MSKLSAEQVSQGLHQPDFGADNQFIANTSDPIMVTPITQDVMELDFYDMNPRVQKNPKYYEIKQSILQTRGLDNPLSITRRPNSERRMVHAGGNTRLSILKELLAELENSESLEDKQLYQKLRYIPTVFHPWESESRTHIAHLIENDQRASLSLLDKSKGIQKQWKIWEQERDEEISQAEFLRLLEQSGYPLSQSYVSRYLYVVNVLLDVIPEALSENLIQLSDIEVIRKIRKSYEKIWADNSGSGQIDPVFYDVMVSIDGSEFSTDKLRKHLDLRIAELLDLDVTSVRQNSDAVLNSGNSKNLKTTRTSPEQNEKVSDNTNTDDKQELSFLVKKQEKILKKNNIDLIRSENFKLVERISAAIGLGTDCVENADTGMGFFIDMPSHELKEPVQIWAWWLLVSLSEQDNNEIISFLNEGNTFKNIRLGHRANDIEQIVGESDLGFSPLTDQSISESVFFDLMLLVKNCRNLRTIACNNNESVWPVAS